MNIKANGLAAPTKMFEQETSEDMRYLLGMIVGHDCIPIQGSTGESQIVGCMRGGDIDYYDCEDCLGYTLIYGYEREGYLSTLFEYEIVRNDLFDHEFDLTREQLRNELELMLEGERYDRRTIEAIGAKFGMLIG